MRTRIMLLLMLIILLVLPMAVNAQETDPVAVTEGHVEAVNEGDATSAAATVKRTTGPTKRCAITANTTHRVSRRLMKSPIISTTTYDPSTPA